MYDNEWICPGENCTHKEDDFIPLETHLRERHCAFCGVKQGEKYVALDHLGREKPSFTERLRRFVEDIDSDELVDWEKHHEGVKHSLIEELYENIDNYCTNPETALKPSTKVNCWHASIVCRECQDEYRRIIAGGNKLSKGLQPYHERSILDTPSDRVDHL